MRRRANPSAMERQATRSSVKRTYEEIAEDVEEGRQTPWNDVVNFEKSIGRGQTVLEMGCGSGRNAVHFAAMGHKVIALDFARGMLAKAADRATQIPESQRFGIVQADVTSLPIRDSSVDVCLFVAVLHHLPTRQERLHSLMAMGRCLRPGGKAFISVWAFEQRRFRRILERHRAAGKEDFGDLMIPIRSKDGRGIRRFYHLFVEGELEQLAAEAGLEIGQHFKSHDNYFAVAVRSNRNR